MINEEYKEMYDELEDEIENRSSSSDRYEDSSTVSESSDSDSSELSDLRKVLDDKPVKISSQQVNIVAKRNSNIQEILSSIHCN